MPRNGGLGWSSVFAVAVGGQYEATDKLTLRAGYLFNTNPISATNTLFNIQAPGFLQHMLAIGVSYKLTDDIVLTAAWNHQFRNAIQGPVFQIPEVIKLDGQIDSIIVGLNVRFGGTRPGLDNSVSYTETMPVLPQPETSDAPPPLPVTPPALADVR
jgi:long-chain fatty acid transport protein